MSRKGIPNFQPTEEQRRQVEMMAAIGIPHEHIAQLVLHAGKPISTDTLTRHFSDELAVGLSKALSMAGGKLFSIALGQNDKASVTEQLRALMFIFNTRGGWATHAKVEDQRDGDDEQDETAVAARIAGLIEKGLRKGKPTVQ